MLKDILNLIRWKTLLIAIFALIATRVFIIDYFYASLEISPLISVPHYALFVLSVVLMIIATCLTDELANYAVYQKIRPEATYIDALIKRKTALILSLVLYIVALILGFFIQFSNDASVILSFTIIVVLMYLYVSKAKHNYFAGKFIISLLYALLFLYPILLELNILYAKADLFRAIGEPKVMQLVYIAASFASFAFLLTFISELIKDLRDEDDDRMINRKTFVTYFGENATKGTIYFLSVVLIVAVAYFQFRYHEASQMMIVYGISILVHIPMLYFINELRKAKAIQDYDFLGKLLSMIFISLLFATTAVKHIITNGLI